MLATLRAEAHGASRVEAFTDDVFAFALTLLVVSLEVPRTFRDLESASRGFVGFALTFAVLGWIWHEHKKLFAHFVLGDALAVFLNFVLLFVVLFYIYPLKFLSHLLMGRLGLLDAPGLTWAETPRLMTIYSGGWVAIFVLFLLLYRHGLARGLAREAGVVPLFRARAQMRAHGISIGVGAVSLLLTLLAVVLHRPALVAWAGLVFFLLGPLHGWWGVRVGRELERLERARPEAASKTA
jgi:uncharacterized membrane protein